MKFSIVLASLIFSVVANAELPSAPLAPSTATAPPPPPAAAAVAQHAPVTIDGNIFKDCFILQRERSTFEGQSYCVQAVDCKRSPVAKPTEETRATVAAICKPSGPRKVCPDNTVPSLCLQPDPDITKDIITRFLAARERAQVARAAATRNSAAPPLAPGAAASKDNAAARTQRSK